MQIFIQIQQFLISISILTLRKTEILGIIRKVISIENEILYAKENKKCFRKIWNFHVKLLVLGMELKRIE